MKKCVIVYIILISILAGCSTSSTKGQSTPTPAPSMPIAASPISSASPNDETAALSNELDQIFANDKNFCGSVLVAQNGKVLLDKGYGMADITNKIANTSTTKFAIGSITKQFTSMSIVQLYAQGQLDIDDRLSKYFPDFLRGDEITLRNLLTHTSGIIDFLVLHSSLSELPSSEDQVIKQLETRALIFDPGTQWSYSNSNYLILGYILQKVSGLSYYQYLSQNIFQPLSMNNTGIIFDNGQKTFSVIGYSAYPDGKPISEDTKALSMDRIVYGAGCLYSTVEDLNLWDQALNTEQLLPKKYIDMIFTPYVTDKLTTNYGLGWEIINDPNFGSVFRHGGAIDGFTAYNYRYVDKDITVIILTNLDRYGGIDMLNTSVMQTLVPYAADSGTTVEQLDQIFLDDKGFHGSVLIAQDGNVILSKGYGLSDKANNIAMTTTTKSLAPSFQFTGVAMMQLYEQGLVDPADTLSKYLADCPHGDEITIKNLLTGSSGFSNYINSCLQEIMALPLENITPETIIKMVTEKPLSSTTGAGPTSINTDYLILASIIEKVSGLSYADYLEKNFFEPLGMENTGAIYENNGQELLAIGYNPNSDYIKSYDKNGTANLNGIVISEDKLMKCILTIYSTVEDLQIWNQALTSEQLLSKKYLDIMLTPYLAFNGTSSIGYGTIIIKDSSFGEFYHISGTLPGYVALNYIIPNKGVSLIILMNEGSYANVGKLANSAMQIFK